MDITNSRDEITPHIRNILRAISPTSQKRLLADVGQEFQRMTHLNFGSGGRYRGAQWSPLSKEYAKQVGHSNSTDIRSGDLYRSIKVGTPREGWIDIYSRSPYAASIAFGDKKRNVPARNFWPTEIYGSPSRQRLTLQADRDMYSFISRRLQILSRGALPYGTMVHRATISYGSPFNNVRSPI